MAAAGQSGAERVVAREREREWNDAAATRQQSEMKDSTLGLLLNIRETKLRIKLWDKLQFELGESEVIVFSRAIYHLAPEGRNTTGSQRRDSSYRHA